jgi:hypothetical protein
MDVFLAIEEGAEEAQTHRFAEHGKPSRHEFQCFV